VLEEWFNEHRNEFIQADCVSFYQAFFDSSKRGAYEARTAALAASFQALGEDAQVTSALGGDTSATGNRAIQLRRHDLEKSYGTAFAAKVLSLSLNEWSVPVESLHGWHLVWLDERSDAHSPHYSEVRTLVVERYEIARRKALAEQFLREAKERYSIRVDEPDRNTSSSVWGNYGWASE
jgi:aspartokinase